MTSEEYTFRATIRAYDNLIEKIRSIQQVMTDLADSKEVSDELITKTNRDIASIGNDNIYAMHHRRIKKCIVCGKMFLAENENQECCTGNNADGVLCLIANCCKDPGSEIGKREYTRLYRNAYNRWKAKLTRGEITQYRFDQWVMAAKHKLSEVRNGFISFEMYRSWITE